MFSLVFWWSVLINVKIITEPFIVSGVEKGAEAECAIVRKCKSHTFDGCCVCELVTMMKKEQELRKRMV